jgi:hypothetical protein
LYLSRDSLNNQNRTQEGALFFDDSLSLSFYLSRVSMEIVEQVYRERHSILEKDLRGVGNKEYDSKEAS